MNIKLTKKYIVSLLPKRPKHAHKGTFGKVLGLAGSENYPGAAYLACAAAYRVGAGLVSLVTNRDTKIIISKKLPEVTFISPDKIDKKLLEYDVILIGPGLGQNTQAKQQVNRLLNLRSTKIVIDGDGLNILSEIREWDKLMENYGNSAVLTPHPGEMARLTKLSVAQIQQDREAMAQKYADQWGQTVVLKGAKTVIASSTGEKMISPFANPALATAGTGDVLAGVIAGFLSQGLNSFEAGCVGVYIHGLAGEKLRKRFDDAGVLASDLLLLLPQIIRQLK